MKPTIYGFAPSTYTQTALMAAEEAGVEVVLSPLEFKQASHLALHPYGKMPVLEHDGLRLFETLAVSSYLDRTFGDGAMTPGDARSQARMFQWISAAIDYAYDDLVGGLHDDDPSAEAVTAACEQLKLLDAALARSGHFAGEAISLADLFVYPMVEFACSKLDDAVVAALPALARWRKSMAARPSAQRVLAS